MSPPNRAVSPGATTEAEAKQSTALTSEGKSVEAASATKFQPPPRPDRLRDSVLTLYAVLAFTIIFYALVGWSMEQEIPEGKFRLKNGTIIPIEDFDPVELGPYPKCHPHHKEYMQVAADGKTQEWVKIDKAPSKGPFPPGHPENPEWVAKSEAEMKQDNAAKRFTWEGQQATLHLLSLASLCTFIGSKHGLFLFTQDRSDGKSGSDISEGPQMIQSEDAYWFPILGSCVLFGMFLIYKYVGAEWVKQMLSCCIICACMGGIGTNFDQFATLVRGKVCRSLFCVPWIEKSVTLPEFVGYSIGAVMGIGLFLTKNWVIHNIFGVSFVIAGMKMINLSSWRTGAIMFVGLFFYDIFWVFCSKSVFGSNVMVTVAKGVEAPIAINFPISTSGCGHLQHSMLGLGDIVVPGLLLSFLAKWDAIKMGENSSKSFVYLNTCMVAYVLSLATTLFVMFFFNAAQPALLYIVPYVLAASVVVAISRGELKELWAFEFPEEDEMPDKLTKPEQDTGDGAKKEK